eukprot:482581-Rhodomonas_salina.1
MPISTAQSHTTHTTPLNAPSPRYHSSHVTITPDITITLVITIAPDITTSQRTLGQSEAASRLLHARCRCPLSLHSPLP